MNATTRKAGKQQRAVFEIEGAIEETRKRITGSAKDLQKKAEAALAPAQTVDGYKFGGATAKNLLRYSCDGVKPKDGYGRMVQDVHSILKGEAGARTRDGFCDGLVYLTQADYSEPARKGKTVAKPKLRTEREGRIFAVDVLERLKNADANKATAYPFSPDASYYGSDETIEPYRKGPQWDGFYRDLSALVESASPEAVKGFASIFTDCLVEDIGFNLDVYREMEAETLFQDFGTPGTKYQAPKRKPPTKAQAREFAENKKKAQGPALAEGEAEAIEQFLQHSGPARRSAMAFLSKPYAEMARIIKTDDKAAEAFAELAVGLEEVKENYLTIALQITRAAREIKRAVFERIDASKVKGVVVERLEVVESIKAKKKQQGRGKRQRAK